MNANQINEIIKNFLDNDILNAILINGKWGVGKTYNVRQFINDEKQNKKLKIGYISMFGKQSLDEVNTELYQCFHKFNKQLRNISSVVKIFNVKINLPGITIGINPNVEKNKQKKEYIKKNNKISRKKYLLIIDDFERKNTNIQNNDFLGYINGLVNQGFKVVILANLNKLEDSNEESINQKSVIRYEELGEFNEKVIDRIYSITDSQDSTISQIFKENTKYLSQELIDELDSNLRMAIKVNSLFTQVKDYVKEKEIKEINFYYIMKSSVYLVIDFFTEKYKENVKNKYTSAVLQKYALENITERINCYKVQTREFLTYLMAIEKIYLEEDYEMFDNLILDKGETNIWESCFYFSDEGKIEQIRKQLNYILGLQEANKTNREMVAKILHDWFTACDCFDLSFIDYNKLYEKIFDLNIDLHPFLHDEIKYKEFVLNYQLYKKNKTLEILKDEILTKGRLNTEDIYNKFIQLINAKVINEKEIDQLNNILKEEEFLLHNLAGEIKEEDWEVNHYICRIVSENLQGLKKPLKQCLLEISEKNNGDISCKDRVDYLINRYIDN